MKSYISIICFCLCLTACFENKEDKILINEIITQFLDMNKIAQNTPRIALTTPLSKMQEYQGELKKLKLSSTCKALQEESIAHMDTILSEHLSFITESNDVLSMMLAQYAAEDLSDLTKLESCSEYNKKDAKQEKKYKERANVIDTKDTDGNTTLMKASIKNSNPTIIEALIKNGVDVNARNKTGATALIMASYLNPNPAIIEALIKNGADVNAKDKDGNTALLIISFINPNFTVIETLIKNGADVNARNNVEDTPLLNACQSYFKNPEKIKTLIEFGADINAKGHKNKTPLSIIKEGEDKHDIAQLLIKHGAKE